MILFILSEAQRVLKESKRSVSLLSVVKGERMIVPQFCICQHNRSLVMQILVTWQFCSREKQSVTIFYQCLSLKVCPSLCFLRTDVKTILKT